MRSIRACARLEGIITDPVYEGKSMQGLMDLVRRGFFPSGSRILYAHLGDEASDRALAAEDGWPLLRAIDPARVSEIARASAQIATTRAQALNEIADELS